MPANEFFNHPEIVVFEDDTGDLAVKGADGLIRELSVVELNYKNSFALHIGDAIEENNRWSIVRRKNNQQSHLRPS